MKATPASLNRNPLPCAAGEGVKIPRSNTNSGHSPQYNTTKPRPRTAPKHDRRRAALVAIPAGGTISQHQIPPPICHWTLHRGLCRGRNRTHHRTGRRTTRHATNIRPAKNRIFTKTGIPGAAFLESRRITADRNRTGRNPETLPKKRILILKLTLRFAYTPSPALPRCAGEGA